MVTETLAETSEPSFISEALILIDEGLSNLQSRELISANEVADLLLDVRGLLTPSVEELGDEKVPVTAN
jgi:hypothetical protein